MPNPIRCLISAGPTREFIDPVRFMSNPSSGKMGYALAEAAIAKGWEVNLVSGPVCLKEPEGCETHHVVTGQDMFEKCSQLFPKCDVLIMCAAVMDMRPKNVFAEKQKKDSMAWNIEFEPVIDILKTLSQQKTHQKVIGFAAETNNVEAYALRKLEEKRLDWIVANDVSGSEAGFQSDANKVMMLSKSGDRVPCGPDSKLNIAKEILEIVI